MTDQIPETADDAIVAALTDLRRELLGRVWGTAVQAANSGDHEIIRELVRLKVDIEAIDFAMAHRPLPR